MKLTAFKHRSPKIGFQIDTNKMALLANQIEAERDTANHRANSEHHFGNQSESENGLDHWITNLRLTQ